MLESSIDTTDMISARDAQECEPRGRSVCASHPGSTAPTFTGATEPEHGLPLVKALKDISIKDSIKKDSWHVRACEEPGCECDEELYINGHTVVWIKGGPNGVGKVIKTFTMDAMVLEALWCTFLLPVDEPVNDEGSATKTVAAEEQKGVCIIQDHMVGIFDPDGREYSTALPFQVSKTWPIKNGLLFERTATAQPVDLSKTPKKEQQNLPMLFSMLHPLDEAAPAICRTGGSSSGAKVSLVTETSQQVVFTSDEPSLIMTFDKLLSAHTIWMLRRAKPEEGYIAYGSVLGGGDNYSSTSGLGHDTAHTPGFSRSTCSAGLSKLTISSQSPSLPNISPFWSHSSKLNSPSGGPSRLNSPSLSRMAALSRSQSPSMLGSLNRFQTPSPTSRSSPAAGLARTPLSFNVSHMDPVSQGDVMEPLMPEVCLDHLWTETGVPRDGPVGKTSKVFQICDMCDQHYLCYLIPYRHQLRCVKFEESNDCTQLIFGSLSIIQAKDAAPISGLSMTLVLDMSNNLILYSGLTKMNQVHVSGLPTALNFPCAMPQPSSSFVSPSKYSSGPTTSSRPASAMDARFDDEVVQLSPVPTECTGTPESLEASLSADISFQPAMVCGAITGIRDPVANRVTLELLDGRMYRASLPPLSKSPLISMCLEGIRQILPRDIAILVLTRWYSTHNSPGSANGQSEWIQFARCLLSMMGYDVTKLDLTRQWDADYKQSPELAPKKARRSDSGVDQDWEYLLDSDHHHYVNQALGHVLGLGKLQPDRKMQSSSGTAVVDTNALLFPNIPALMFTLHLVYEELKLDALLHDELHQLSSLLYQLACDLRCPLYADHYCRDHPRLFCRPNHSSQLDEHLQQMQYPNFLTKDPPSIHQWLYDFLAGRECLQFPVLPYVGIRTTNVIAMYVGMFEDSVEDVRWSTYIRKVAAADGARRKGHRTADIEVSLTRSFLKSQTANPHERVVLFMTQLQTSIKSCLRCGVSLPLKEAIFHCRHFPPLNWPEQAYSTIGREDLGKQRQRHQHLVIPNRDGNTAKIGKDEEDGMEYMDMQLLKLRFSEDLRVQETRRLLQSARPVRIALVQRPEVTDHDFIEEQERHLFATCIRTMALPLGRGLFTMRTFHPVSTETLPIPKLCLTGRAPPRNTSVDLTHIDTPANMGKWPQFHNGVAAGLRIANSSQVDSTWILYNKPKSSELTNEHAGFLMGLGLNGHLSSLATLNVHDYLCKGHEMTSVGLLLGIAAGQRGSMDVATTRLLSIHIVALLPPTSTELEIPHNTQVAAILGVGLVYQGTAHRHMAEVLLSEIGRPPGPEMENCTDRESYSLAAGLALGMVTLGKGKEMAGLSDMNMADELYHYMTGGHKKPLSGAYKERYKSPSYQIKEGSSVNVDVTSPGATLALGMMFFKTGNSAVAEWLRAPDTQFLLDFVRPDFLMLRTLSRGLVMWDSISPSMDWVKSNMPEIVYKYAFQKGKFKDDPNCDVDFVTMSQAYCNIAAGACMSLGLKFAGSANQDAFKCLYSLNKKVLDLLKIQGLVGQAGKSTVESCLMVALLSLAMVMAGTGNLEVMRLCRHLRSRLGPSYSHVLYGSQMSISMALGLLFMGGGRYTLSTTPNSVAAMLCAFFPKFPIHSNDNRYHLQAFRHLYILATEPRLLLPRDVDSGLPCYVPIRIKFKDNETYIGETFTCIAPGILPELHLLQEVKVEGPRYWPICFQSNNNWAILRELLNNSGCLYVKQRAGHLAYADDPKGYHSVLSKSLTQEPTLRKIINIEEIQSFSSDPEILYFAEQFCTVSGQQEYTICQFLSRVLYECVTQEKPEVLPVYMMLHRVSEELEHNCDTGQLWQLKLMLAFYERTRRQRQQKTAKQLISQDFLLALKNMVEKKLQDWISNSTASLLKYFNAQPLSEKESNMLSAFLVWYDIPHPTQLVEAGLQSRPTFPELYLLLQPAGLSVSTILTLTEALSNMNQSSPPTAGHTR